MKKIFLLAMAAAMLLPLTLSAKEPGRLVVISYNIRLGTANDGTNSWEYRYPASAMMIDDQKPDIFGLQEAYDFQVNYLTNACDGYKSVGVGREDGKHEGEHMSIFYKKKNIKLLKWGTYWLSDTPDVPSMGWDAACKRTATWALMKDKRSGKKFYYVNTHLDHVGTEAREKGLNLIMDNIKKMNPEGLPLVLTGDFNMTIDNPNMDEIKVRMKNTREVAAKTDSHATFNGWGKSGSIIDYIWFSGFSSCPEYETVTTPYMDRAFISDHYPVKAVLVF